VLGQTELADVDGVLGDRVELRGVAAKPALVSEGMGNVCNQDVGGIRKEGPEPQAGESANEAVATIHMKSGTRLAGPHNYRLPLLRYDGHIGSRLFPGRPVSRYHQPLKTQ
jgi:hypothetical protein